jgi:hypothetical protein
MSAHPSAQFTGVPDSAHDSGWAVLGDDPNDAPTEPFPHLQRPNVSDIPRSTL